MSPSDPNLFERSARIEEWIAGSGVDLALQLKETDWAFTPLGTRLMYDRKDTTNENFLDVITPADAQAILTNPKARGGYIASLGGAVSAYPGSANYIFKTRHGTIGLLRLDGFTNEVNGVKLRYRLAQESANSSTTTSALTPVQFAELEFRLVAAEGDTRTRADELADPNDRTGRQKLRVLKEVLLDSSAVASASRETNGPADLKTIGVILKDAAVRKFAGVTATNIGRQLAIVWRGRILSAPVIRTPISGPAMSISGNLSDAETLVLLDLLNYRAGAGSREADLMAARTRLQELRSKYTDAHPLVVRQLELIKALETK